MVQDVLEEELGARSFTCLDLKSIVSDSKSNVPFLLVSSEPVSLQDIKNVSI